MSRSNVAVPTLLLLLLPTSLNAAVIERDWQMPGDGLLTFDTVNQREWLDLSETLLSNFGNSGSSHLTVLDELVPGGLFSGFRFANSEDVLRLILSAGIDDSTIDITLNGIAASKLTDLLTITSVSQSRTHSARGVVDSDCSCTLVASIFVATQFNSAGIAFRNFLSLGDPGGVNATTGVMLYRQVPEPSGIILALCSLSVLCSARRFRV